MAICEPDGRSWNFHDWEKDDVKIYKYKIEIINKWFKLSLPENFKPLTVQRQPDYGYGNGDGPICMWALVDPGKQPIEYDFLAIGTGFDFNPQGASYIGTTQSNGFVFHLFFKL